MSTAPQPRPARRVSPNPPSSKRRSKQESLRIVQALKRGTLIASTLIFGGLVALVARHNVHASTNTLSGSITPSTSTPATHYGSPSGGHHDFFNNQGQGGYGFGTVNNQPPVTGFSSS